MNCRSRIYRSTNILFSRRRRHPAGMTLPELLIALAITAILLAAVAVAFDAGLQNYSANQDLTVASRSARNALNRMAATIRSAWNDPHVDTIQISEDGAECALVDADGRDIVYFHDSDESRLELSIDGGDNWHVLLDGVHSLPGDDAVFTSVPCDDPDFAAGTVGRVEIRFQIEHGDTTYPVSTAVVPRNILFH